MPRLNINFEPVPEVAPTGAPGNDYFRIQASPEAFGAPVAKGLQSLGQGIEHASEAGLDVVKFHDKVATDSEVNNYIDERIKTLYGDPSRPTTGPDGKPVPDTGFMGLTGRAALDGQQAALQRLQDARQRGLNNLTSPEAKLRYENETRRMFAEAQGHIGQHAEQQQKIWAQGVNATGADLNLTGFVNSLENPETARGFAQRYIESKVSAATLHWGEGPQVRAAAEQDARRDLLEAHVNAVAVKDPAGAIALLDKNKEVAGVKYDDIYNRLRVRAEDATTTAAANRHVADATFGGAGLRAAPASMRYNNPGAMWMGPTAARWGATSKVDLPGGNNIAVFSNPVNGAAAHLDLLQSKYAGMTLGDAVEKWSGGHSSGAYTDFVAKRASIDSDTVLTRDLLSGDTGIAIAKAQAEWEAGRPSPISDEQWRQASQMVASGAPAAAGGAAPAVMTATAGGSPAVTSPETIRAARASQLADAMRSAEEDPDLTEKERDQTLAKIQRRFHMLEIEDNVSTKAKTEAANKAAGGYVTELADLMHTPNPDYVALAGRIAHDPVLQSQPHILENLLDRVRHVSGEEQALAFGPGYLQARESLFSPPGTPGHLDDFSQLVTRTDITMAGLKDLHDRLTLVKGDVDHRATEERMNSFLRYAKHEMSFEEDTGFFKIRDPKGEAIYNGQFVPDFIKRASDLTQEAQRTGERKRLDEFLSLDNVKKIVEQYRPKRQMDADRMRAQGSGQEAPEAAGTPLPPPPEGVNPAAWTKVMGHTPTLDNGQAMSHARWGNVLRKLIEDPSEEVMKALDSHLGGTGFTAKDLVEALSTEPGESQAAPGVMDWARSGFNRENPGNPLAFIGRGVHEFATAGQPQPLYQAPTPGMPGSPGQVQGAPGSPSGPPGPAATGPSVKDQLADLDRREEALKRSGLGGAFRDAQIRQIEARRRELEPPK